MNKQAKIALIRQYLSGADLSESRCYILEVGEQPPTDYRRSVDTVIWVTDDRGEVKKPTGKNDILIQVTSKETVKQVKKLGDYLDKQSEKKQEPQPTSQQTAEKIKSWLPAPIQQNSAQPMGAPAPMEPAAIPIQPRTIPNPRAGYRRTHI
jgi:hypothetical protein